MPHIKLVEWCVIPLTAGLNYNNTADAESGKDTECLHQ